MTHTSYNSTKSMLIVGSIVALSMIAMVNPAAAYYNQGSNDIDVSSSNSASVLNAVVVGANTGYNTVAGGNTGKGGNGGDASGKNANGGHGGTSGSSNNEAIIGTGNAAAIGTVNNNINSNRTKVTTNCGCENRHSKGGDITVASQNEAEVGNVLGVDANTGDNAVLGGTTGKAGNGGDASASSHSWSKWSSHHNKGGANAGHGGNTGGTNNVAVVLTGESVADGLVVNVVNRNVTRVAR